MNNVIIGLPCTKFYTLNGKLHRENGPACEYADGTKEWYINGKRHRENGPAIEWSNGSGEWYINGKELTEEQFNNRNVKKLSMNELEEILKDFSMDELKEILGRKVKIVKK